MKERRADTVQSFFASLLLHALFFALVYFGLWWTRTTAPELLKGPVIEAELVDPNALTASMRRTLAQRPAQPAPAPPPPAETAPEETTPEQQPEPEPIPEDAPTPPQPVAQEQVPKPDTREQELATPEAISQKPPVDRAQEERRRQEQIDLTQRERQQEVERQRRLSAMEQMRQKQLADIRRQREAARKEANLAEQKLRQLADARRPAEPAASDSADAAASPPPGMGGQDDDLRARYLSAISNAVRMNWTRPDDVPTGVCPIHIEQARGGRVERVEVLPGCPYDELTRRSVEAAVLKAQPLPYAGFERVFIPSMTLRFRAE